MWLRRLVLFAALAFSLAQDALGAKTRNQKPESVLIVRTYNYAGVSSQTLAQAEETAAWIFREARIEMRWIDCPTRVEDVLKFPDCETVAYPLDRTVKILPQAMSERFGLPATQLGFALWPSQAYIFFDRVIGVTKDTQFAQSRVLGHIMAHELGHLLLEGEAHTDKGIMNSAISCGDLGRPGRLLLFTKSQSKRLLAQLRQDALAKKGWPSSKPVSQAYGDCLHEGCISRDQ